jgi:threonine/homoserine/homoserine lactone efflux protein
MISRKSGGNGTSEVDSLFFGIVFGLAAGLSPGPLITLVVSETLKNGRKEGIEVAVAPLISEPPIIAFVLIILSRIAGNSILMAMISLLGACYLAYLGLSNLKAAVKPSRDRLEKSRSLLKGVTTNLLNPNAYMFWLTIGGPRILEGAGVNVSAAILFVLGFYGMLVGSKITVAVIVDKSKAFVKNRCYVYLIRVLGVVLIVFALIFVREALVFFGIL